jgi:hypothetical protein
MTTTKEETVRVEMWNVGTMSGREREIMDEMECRKVEILNDQETNSTSQMQAFWHPCVEK